MRDDLTAHQVVEEINKVLATELAPDKVVHLRCGVNIRRWPASERRCIGPHLYSVSFPDITIKQAREIKAAARQNPPTVVGRKLRFSANGSSDGPKVFYCFLSLRSINGPRFIPEDE